MKIKFPCGASGEPTFCPNSCTYGKFCKVKDQKKEVPRGLSNLEADADIQENEDKTEAEVSFYY